MRKADDFTLVLPLVTLALNTGNAARRVVKAQVGKRGTGARIDHDDPRQDPEAKKIAINKPARGALEWLRANCYGDLLFMWPWGDSIGKVYRLRRLQKGL